MQSKSHKTSTKIAKRPHYFLIAVNEVTSLQTSQKREHGKFQNHTKSVNEKQISNDRVKWHRAYLHQNEKTLFAVALTIQSERHTEEREKSKDRRQS